MSFKKNASKCIALGLTISFISSLLFSTVSAIEKKSSLTNTNKLEINLNQEILNVLKNYFSYQFKYINNIDSINNDEKYIFLNKGSLLEEYFDINNDYLKKILSLENSKVESFSDSISYKELGKEGNILKLEVENIINFKYEDSDMPSLIDEKHIIYLQRENDKYKIIRDLYDSEEDLKNLDKKYGKDENSYKLFVKNKKKAYDNNIGKIMNSIENDKKEGANINNSIDNSKEKRFRRYTPYRYDRYNAAKWALNNCEKIKEDFYRKDCTNFVSKAMFFGGKLPVDKTWYYHSGAWIRVIELRNWLLRKGYAKEYSNYKYAYQGDIIQYKNKENIWRHSVIVTTRTSSYPYVRVTAHSNNRVDVNVSGLYYPYGEFKSYRVLHMK